MAEMHSSIWGFRVFKLITAPARLEEFWSAQGAIDAGLREAIEKGQPAGVEDSTVKIAYAEDPTTKIKLEVMRDIVKEFRGLDGQRL